MPAPFTFVRATYVAVMLFRMVEPPPSKEAVLALEEYANSLEKTVKSYAVPRSRTAEAKTNRRTEESLARKLSDLGYKVTIQGPFRNVVAQCFEGEPETLLATHYDSVPNSPGADDNATGMAALLAIAERMAARNEKLAFCLFNAEEEGLRGSMEFVRSGAAEELGINKVHVLEMLGYWSSKVQSQRAPGGLPLPFLPERGDFLGVLSDERSLGMLEQTLEQAEQLASGPKILGLGLPEGLEWTLSDMLRSDHASFWSANIPALLWTDTAEFRNPNYHRPSDTPNTINYKALARVTLLLETLLSCKEY